MAQQPNRRLSFMIHGLNFKKNKIKTEFMCAGTV